MGIMAGCTEDERVGRAEECTGSRLEDQESCQLSRLSERGEG